MFNLTQCKTDLNIYRERGRGRGSRRRKNRNRNGGAGRRDDTDVHDAGEDVDEDIDYPETIDIDGCMFPALGYFV